MNTYVPTGGFKSSHNNDASARVLAAWRAQAGRYSFAFGDRPYPLTLRRIERQHRHY